jgi:type II secretory pathway component PulK
MNERGQGLVEALIALGAAVVIISAITIAVVTSVHNSDFSSYQSLASNYAQQGMEIVQQQSQLDWNDTATYSGTGIWCLPERTTDFYSHITDSNCSLNNVNIQNKFLRLVEFKTVSSCGTNIQAEVTVKWADSNCSINSGNAYCHQVVLDSCIADINRTR